MYKYTALIEVTTKDKGVMNFVEKTTKKIKKESDRHEIASSLGALIAFLLIKGERAKVELSGEKTKKNSSNCDDCPIKEDCDERE